jgi:hypothetical protein
MSTHAKIMGDSGVQISATVANSFINQKRLDYVFTFLFVALVSIVTTIKNTYIFM